MNLRSGMRLGPYEIVAPIGAGGMGEVYRGRDTRLGRSVAIKILRSDLAGDPKRKVRFEREAKAISALNHPHICTLHDVGQEDGIDYLVMELCEGKTLAWRLTNGPLPIEEVIEYGVQIADAMEKAHRQGIVHRDLKPSNIMLTKSGVKLLDFGLAKQKADALAEDQTATSTVQKPANSDGDVPGTVQYMAPELLAGVEADARSDIFALGLVLYEMTTGRRAFDGSSRSSVIAAILRDQPVRPTELAPATPIGLERLIKHCLAKEPDDRVQSAHDVKLHLQSIGTAGGLRPRLRNALVVLLAAAVVVAIGYSSLRRPAERPAQASLPQPEFKRLTDRQGVESAPTLSPDGKFVAYVSTESGNADIYFLRTAGGSRAINLTADSTKADTQPAFSPDGEQIAFRSARDGGGIYVMGATGESPRRVTNVGFDPAWSPDARELVVSTEVSTPFGRTSSLPGQLWRVNVASGERRPLTGNDECDAVQPSWSPNGHRIAFWTLSCDGRDRGDILTIAANGGRATRVTDDEAFDWNPRWSPDGQHIYFASDRGGGMNLWRVAVDEKSGEVRGEPVRMTSSSSWSGFLSVGAGGRRVAFATSVRQANLHRITLDPAGPTVMAGPERVTRSSMVIIQPAVSPDGEWIAFADHSSWRSLYVVRRDGSDLRQITDGRSVDFSPTWSPDGKRIAFHSSRGGSFQIWSINADGSELRQMSALAASAVSPSWSPDGSRIAVFADRICPSGTCLIDARGATPASTLEQLPIYREGRVFGPRAEWSPDGKWLATVLSRIDGADEKLLAYSVDARTYVDLGEPGRPVWLPDSRRLIVRRRSRFDVVDVKTRKSRVLHESPLNVRWPVLSSDGRDLYFTDSINEGDIWLMEMK